METKCVLSSILWDDRISKKVPCHATELVHFRNRIGTEGFEKIFQMSVALHGKSALESVVNIDTTVQEKTSLIQRMLS